MPLIGQSIIEGGILIDTSPPTIGLSPPTRRATGSSRTTVPQLSIPTVSAPAPSGFASATPSHECPNSHTPPPGTPPLVADGETNSPLEEVAPSTPPAGLNRTSVPESFGQKNDPPSYITAHLQFNVSALQDDVKALEKKVEVYSAQSQADLAIGTASLMRSLGKMILDSEARSRTDVKNFRDDVSADMKKLREELTVKFDLIFNVMNSLGGALDTAAPGEQPVSEDLVPALPDLAGSRPH